MEGKREGWRKEREVVRGREREGSEGEEGREEK